MAFRWRYHDGDGEDIVGPQRQFEDQVEAEDWLSESWRELLDGGVSRVTLLQDEAEGYGPMSLQQE